MTISVRLAASKPDVENCLRLRWTVFVEEQSVPPSLEVDAHDRDPKTVHALGYAGAIPAATGRVVFLAGGVAKIGRMAVIDDVRGRGLGVAILQLLEAAAEQRGATSVTLGAQVQARPFYEKQGYAAHGDVFDDAGIPHIEMRKTL